MESQIRTVGVLSIIVGIAGAGLATIMFLFFNGGSFGFDYFPFGDLVISGWLIWMLVLCIPYIVSGIGLILLKPWGRTWGTIVLTGGIACFPFGTALGLYGVWMLLSSEADAIFSPRFHDGYGRRAPRF